MREDIYRTTIEKGAWFCFLNTETESLYDVNLSIQKELEIRGIDIKFHDSAMLKGPGTVFIFGYTSDFKITVVQDETIVALSSVGDNVAINVSDSVQMALDQIAANEFFFEREGRYPYKVLDVARTYR